MRKSVIPSSCGYGNTLFLRVETEPFFVNCQNSGNNLFTIQKLTFFILEWIDYCKLLRAIFKFLLKS